MLYIFINELFYLVCYFLYLLFIKDLNTFKKVSIINSVRFLFELELKQFKLSKILPMWEIGVYIVLIKQSIVILLAIFYVKNGVDIYFKSLMA